MGVVRTVSRKASASLRSVRNTVRKILHLPVCHAPATDSTNTSPVTEISVHSFPDVHDTVFKNGKLNHVDDHDDDEDFPMFELEIATDVLVHVDADGTGKCGDENASPPQRRVTLDENSALI